MLFLVLGEADFWDRLFYIYFSLKVSRRRSLKQYTYHDVRAAISEGALTKISFSVGPTAFIHYFTQVELLTFRKLEHYLRCYF